jgi:Replication-relaxation
MERDNDIYQAIAKFQFLTAEHIANLTGRDHKTIQKRLQMLTEAKLLNRQRRDEMAPYVYFLAEKGGHVAYSQGYLPEVRWIKGKSRILINHDLEITEFHLALEKAFSGQVEWEQWRGDLKDHIETREGVYSLIPDAKFTLNTLNGKGGGVFFLEVVKSYESEYENGDSNLFTKIALYSQYKNQFRKKYGADDFRVLWILPTEKRVLNLLVKIADSFPSRKFYVTDEARYRKDIRGHIRWTAKDFETTQHSIEGGSNAR